jgi:catechol 2,3-dioxygenase-like lactoylglutathione lyase family enzyme
MDKLLDLNNKYMQKNHKGVNKMGNIRPLHVGISVYDMKESIEWYKKNLGFKQISDDYYEFLQARIVFIENEDFQIELFEYKEPKALPQDRKLPNSDLQTVGTKHIAFYTDDISALLDKFRNNEVDIVMERVMEGNSMCFVRDNSGVLIEFIEKKD